MHRLWLHTTENGK